MGSEYLPKQLALLLGELLKPFYKFMVLRRDEGMG